MSKLHPAPASARSIGFRRSSNPRPILSSSRSSVRSPSRLTFSVRRSAGATWFSASAGDAEAANRSYRSGSIAHGTHNSPLGDADGGVVIDRRPHEFRAYGPDAPGGGLGPEAFYRSFAAFIEPRVRAAGYPDLSLDLTGDRRDQVRVQRARRVRGRRAR